MSARDQIAWVLGEHRWKSMGSTSVECECGEVVLGEASPFPADGAFRGHLADEILSEVGDATEMGERLSALLCDLTGGRLSKASYPVSVMTQAIEEHLGNCYESDAVDALLATQQRVDAAEARLAAVREACADLTYQCDAGYVDPFEVRPVIDYVLEALDGREGSL